MTTQKRDFVAGLKAVNIIVWAFWQQWQQNIFKRDIDLCAKSGLSNTGEKYILGNTIYV